MRTCSFRLQIASAAAMEVVARGAIGQW